MSPQTPKIAVLTSGGDAPGMNACVRAVVRCALDCGVPVVGIEQGFEGLLEGRFRELVLSSVGGVLDRGGTFLGTSRSEHFKTPEGVAQAAGLLRAQGVTGVVVIGGDGSYRGSEALTEAGIPTVGVPGTIDNDVAGTDTSIGFDTALNTVCEAIGKVRDTASSHERTFVIEVMGRTSGLLATYAGLAAGADCVLIPEVPWKLEDVCSTVLAGVRRGKKHTIVIITEGAGHAFGLAQDLGSTCGQDVRAVVLGHVQRGGSPSAFDRILAARMGERSVHALLDREEGVAVGLRGSQMVTYPLSEAYESAHALRHEIYKLANVLAR